MADPIWVTKDGRQLLVSEMASSHIRNSIAKIKRSPMGWRRGYLGHFFSELKIRAVKEEYNAKLYLHQMRDRDASAVQYEIYSGGQAPSVLSQRARLLRANSRQAAAVRTGSAAGSGLSFSKSIQLKGHYMPTSHHTSLSFFRSATFDRSSGNEGYIPLALRAFWAEKQFPIQYFRGRQAIAGKLLHSLLLRDAPSLKADTAEMLVRLAHTPIEATLPIKKYRGSAEQNVNIDRSLTLLNSPQTFVGLGAAAQLRLPVNLLVDDIVSSVPIAIIGHGAAGIITYSALREMGYRNVKVFEKRGALGIWSQPNVRHGTKNNPRTLSFADRANLELAAGDGTKDGGTVASFLEVLADKFGLRFSGKVNIDRIEVGRNLDHRIVLETGGGTETYPIVINAMGTGTPRELDDRSRMRIVQNSERPLATRWQSVTLRRSDVEGTRFIFIGLGNSTAEMISQIHELQSQGAQVDYKILTHYTRDAINNPDEAAALPNGKTVRVFRDLTKPDLTGFQGDLRRARADYYRALADGRIIPDVTSWGTIRNKLTYRQRNGSRHELAYDSGALFALTGYQHSQNSLNRMGIVADADGAPIADYDGEFSNPATGTIKGYFGIGAVMDGPSNRNATVIPGMMFRLPDLLYSVTMRAAEHALKEGD